MNKTIQILFAITLVLILAAFSTTTTHNILRSHKILSFYVANILDIYVTDIYGKDFQYGHASLGTLLSAKHEQWSSIWASVIAWYIDQMTTSPLRTYDADTADLIFVPAILNQLDPDQQNKFISEANQFLPHLNKTLHILVLNHAPSWYHSTLLTHENSKSFVFLSWGQLDGLSPHIIGAPALSFVHWSRGSKQLQTKNRHFDANSTKIMKTVLAAESFVLRDYPDRYAVYKDCKELPDNCTHLDLTSPKDGVLVYEAFQSAWYVFHPRGDFLTRNSLFDTLLANAIPVFFQSEYINSVPFNDVLNYTTMAVYIPEKEILAENRTNLVKKLADNFNEQEALSKIKYIHNKRHIFQYMLNPDHGLIRWDQRSLIHPGDDAFTFTIKSVLRNACNRGWLTKKCG